MSPVAASVSVTDLFAEAGVRLDDARAGALEAYLDLLLRWSARMNLTGFRDRGAAAEGLLLDGAFVAPLLPAGDGGILDVGAGAGGLATAVLLLRPDLTLRAVEPRGRRAAFLRAVRRELRLDRLEVVEGRAEDVVPAGLADAAYARAVLPPEAWMPLGLRLVRPGGRVLCLTSTPLEARDLPEGCEVLERRDYRLPRSGARRSVTAVGVAQPGSSKNA